MTHLSKNSQKRSDNDNQDSRKVLLVQFREGKLFYSLRNIRVLNIEKVQLEEALSSFFGSILQSQKDLNYKTIA